MRRLRAALIITLLLVFLGSTIVIPSFRQLPKVFAAGPTLVQKKSNNCVAACSTFTIAFTSSVTAGNQLIVSMMRSAGCSGAGTSDFTISDTETNTFVQKGIRSQGNNCASDYYVASVKTTGSDTITFTAGTASNVFVGNAYEFSGLGAFSSNGTNSGSGTAVSVSSFSPSGGQFVFGSGTMFNSGPTAFTHGANYVLGLGSVGVDGSGCSTLCSSDTDQYNTSWISGATTVPFTAPISGSWVDIYLVFSPGVTLTVNLLLSNKLLPTKSTSTELNSTNFFYLVCAVNGVKTNYQLYKSATVQTCDPNVNATITAKSQLSNETIRWITNTALSNITFTTSASFGSSQSVTYYYYNLINDSIKLKSGSGWVVSYTAPSSPGTTDNPASENVSLSTSYTTVWHRVGDLLNMSSFGTVTATSTTTTTFSNTTSTTTTTTTTTTNHTTTTTTTTNTTTTTTTTTSNHTTTTTTTTPTTTTTTLNHSTTKVTNSDPENSLLAIGLILGIGAGSVVFSRRRRWNTGNDHLGGGT